jgi:pyruvate formate lyase activating enzyme
VGQRRTPEEVLSEVLTDRVFYEQSGGGVTLSGGEPLAQPAFLLTLLRACQENQLHTVLDTTGHGNQRHLLEAAEHADLLLYDLKAFDCERHRRLTGVSNEIILRNLEAVSRAHKCIWIRLPVVPGYNDDLSDLKQMAQFVASLAGIQKVSLLPFHPTGFHKWQRLGLLQRLDDVMPPSPGHLARIRSLFEGAQLTVDIGH